jgi:hypothetical protein
MDDSPKNMRSTVRRVVAWIAGQALLQVVCLVGGLLLLAALIAACGAFARGLYPS